MNVKVGSTVPLEAQVACQDDEIVYVRAEIRDANGTQIATRDMVNGGNGRFYNYSYNMPNVDFISVQYRPFDDASYSIPSVNFCADTETFMKLEEVAAGEGSSSGVIIGKVLVTPLLGKLRPHAVLLGKIKIQKLSGVIKQNIKIVGEIKSYTLKGRLISCKN